MARLRGNNGQLVTQASFSTITYQVTNLQSGTIAGSGSLAPASVLLNSLVQYDPRWTRDSAGQLGSDGSFGYNFLAQLPGASIFNVTPPAAPPLTPAPAAIYQIDVVFTPVSGEAFRMSFQAPAVPVYV